MFSPWVFFPTIRCQGLFLVYFFLLVLFSSGMLGPMKLKCENKLFSIFRFPFSSAERNCACPQSSTRFLSLPGLTSYQELDCVAPQSVPSLTHETSNLQNVFFLRGFPYQFRSPAVSLQVRVSFTNLGISQICCNFVLDTNCFEARRFLCFLTLPTRVFIYFFFQSLLGFAWCFVSRYCPTWIRCLTTGSHPILCPPLHCSIRPSSPLPLLWQ